MMTLEEETESENSYYDEDESDYKLMDAIKVTEEIKHALIVEQNDSDEVRFKTLRSLFVVRSIVIILCPRGYALLPPP